MMRKKFILPALATLALALTPLVGPQVSAAPVAHAALSLHAQIATAMGHTNIGPRACVGGDVCYDNIPFTGTANGGTGGSSSGCTGPIIGVYGSSALKSLIQQAAKDFCTSAGNTNHYDVEYNATGDSCPGDLFASQDSTDPIVGVSDVFPGACAVEGINGVDASKITDFKLDVNIVDMIATCPGATEPNGGALHPAGTTQCSHFASDPTANNGSTCAPSNLSVPATQLLFNVAIGNEQSVGGCSHSPATVENRVQGSGTRVTWCFNVYAAGLDNCNNAGSTTGPLGTTGAMVGAVCGTNPPDGNFAQGYVTRSAVVGDPRSTSTPKTALQGCGVVALGGVNAYNGPCDPTNAAATGGAPSPVHPASTDCPGDNDVAAGRYTAWGYEHSVLNNANNAAAVAFNNFLQSSAEDTSLTQQFGFMRQCQMGFSRAVDGDVYSVATATC